MSASTKVILALIVIVFILAAIWYVFGEKLIPSEVEGPTEEAAPETKGPIKIGVSLPLTGPVADSGKWALKGINLAVDDVNSQGGIDGRPIELIVEDDKCDAKEGVNIINKILNIDRPKIFIVYCGTVGAAVAEILEGKALTYCIALRTEPLEGKYPSLFNLMPSADKESSLMAKKVYDLNIKKVAILYQANFFGESYKNKFKKIFSALGGEIVSEGKLDNFANPDLRTDLAKAKEAGAEAIFTPFNPAQYTATLKQAKELGFDVKFFSTPNTEAQTFLDAAGDLAEGIVYTYSFQESSDEYYKNFAEKYKGKYGRPPEMNAANGYDSIMLTAEGMKVCGEEAACLVRETQNIKDYAGVGGTIKSFVDGIADKDIFLKTVKNGKFVPYEE